MECLHDTSAASSTTQNGTFWFCGQKPSCNFFCSDEDSYMMTKAVESFRESGNLQPICPVHQKLAKLCMVKDKTKLNYARPFFVCAEREDTCTFWQWGDILNNPPPRCSHGLVCRTRKVKKEGKNQNRLFYCCAKENEACNFFEWKPTEDSPRIQNLGVLFVNPLQYQYKVVETGEKFTSRKVDTKDAYEQYLFLKSVNALTSEFSKLSIT